MFTIQYVHPVTKRSVMQEVDTRSSFKLVQHLARFEHEILEVYERTTPITKRMRAQLTQFGGNKSPAARRFIEGGIRFRTPA